MSTLSKPCRSSRVRSLRSARSAVFGGVQGLNNLAVIYTAQGKAQEALQTLQAATLADPGYAEVRLARHVPLAVLHRRLTRKRGIA